MPKTNEVVTVARTVIEGSSAHTDIISSIDLLTNDYKADVHSHDAAQLLLVVRGLVTLDVGANRWLVPPQSAIWIPAGMEHSMFSIGEVELHCVYLSFDQADLPLSKCCTFAVSPLLRELIIEMSHLPGHVEVNGPYARLIKAMLDQLTMAPPGPLQLTMPTDARLRKIADALLADPADRTTISGWSRKIGMSERTLHRALLKETGMSFGHWRRQFHISLALQRLAQGESIQSVAFYLGYNSSSNFVAMFRKALGKPPLKFLAGH